MTATLDAPTTTVDAPVSGPRARPVVLAVVTLGVPLLAYGLHARRYGRWIIDDAAISYAYARSIADGHGVVQQPGAPAVEGVSNPLWTALLVLLKWVGLFDSGRAVAGWPDYVALPKLIGAACLLGTLGLLWWAFRPLLGGYAWIATLLTGVGLALIPSYVIWTVSGLENPIYGLLVTALAAVLTRAVALDRLTSPRVALTTGGLVLLCGFTRPDGIVYFGAYPLLLAILVTRARLWPSARAVLLSGLAFGVPMAAFLLARHAEFGLWVPNTAVAKAQQGISVTGMAKVSDLVEYVGWPVVLTAAAVVGLAMGLCRRRGQFLGFVVCLLPALGAFGVLERDWMAQYRFATPIWVTATPLFAACLVWTLSRGGLSRRGVTVLAAVAAVSVVFSGALFRTESATFRAAPTTPLCKVADRYGRLFNTYADRLRIGEGSLALPDIGGTLLTTRLRIVDTAGLTDRTIAEARHDGNFGAIGDYLFDQVKPTFIHFHRPWDRGIAGDPRLARDYAEIVPGDYVRRDAVTDQAALTRLRAERLGSDIRADLSSCGARLTPGSS